MSRAYPLVVILFFLFSLISFSALAACFLSYYIADRLPCATPNYGQLSHIVIHAVMVVCPLWLTCIYFTHIQVTNSPSFVRKWFRDIVRAFSCMVVICISTSYSNHTFFIYLISKFYVIITGHGWNTHESQQV